MNNSEKMKLLRVKVLAFLTFSAVDPDTLKKPGDKSAFDSSERKMTRQDEMIVELQTLAREEDTMVGRTLKFPMADSYALYVVVTTKKNVAVVHWIDYCDGWQDDRLGSKGTLPLSYVKEKIEWEDSLSKIFS